MKISRIKPLASHKDTESPASIVHKRLKNLNAHQHLNITTDELNILREFRTSRDFQEISISSFKPEYTANLLTIGYLEKTSDNKNYKLCTLTLWQKFLPEKVD